MRGRVWSQTGVGVVGMSVRLSLLTVAIGQRPVATGSAGDCSSVGSTYWDHTKCGDPGGCCTTDWSTEGPDDCCQRCQNNGTCAAWEWAGDDLDGPACYRCTTAVLPFRTFMCARASTSVSKFGPCATWC